MIAMSTKTISLEEEAYERLKRLKRKGESFTDLVNRLTGKRSLLELSGTISEEEASDLRMSVENASKERKEARKESREVG